MDKPVVEFPFTSWVKGQAKPGAAVGGDAGTLNLLDYWRTAKRHKWGILGVTLVAVLLGGLKAMSAVPIYRASLSILIEPSLPRLVSIQQPYMLTNPWLFYQTQSEVMHSRALAGRVVRKLGLEDRYDLEKVPDTKETLLAYIKGRLGLDEPKTDNIASQLISTPEEKKRRQRQLVSRIQGGLSVKTSDRSQIVVLSFDSPDPQFAADVVNAVAEAYIAFTLEERVSRAQQASRWLTERLEEMRKKVVESEAALQSFQSREGMLNTERIKATETARLTSFSERLLNAERTYAEMVKRYGSKHPKLINAKAELSEARQRIKEERAQILEAKRKAFELAKLEQDVSTNRQLYELFMTRFKETDITTDKEAANARVIDYAEAPAAPYKPNKTRILGTYLGVGLLLGVLLAFLREHLDNTFKTPGDVEDKLNMPVLGIVPLLNKKQKDAKSGLQPERHFIKEPRSSFAESINHIRTGILFSQVDNPPKTVMVTSPVQGEGKTTLASNLALSFCQLGRTLLLDADLRKPKVAQITGLDKRVGLVDLVAGQKSSQECIVQDREADNLYILRTGTMPPNPLELISSSRFSTLLEDLKGHFDHIVIDTAPVLPVSDAIVLGRIVDGLIMVVQADRTTQAMVQDSLKRLTNAKIAPLGIALAQVSQRKMSQYYYDRYYSRYYYGKYYHAYYGEDESGRKVS